MSANLQYSGHLLESLENLAASKLAEIPSKRFAVGCAEYDTLTLSELYDMDAQEIAYLEELEVGDVYEHCIRHLEADEERYGMEIVKVRRVA